MDVVDTLGSLDLGDPSAILRYWESELLQALYFRPKGVSAAVRDAALCDEAFAKRLSATSELMREASLAQTCAHLLDGFSADCGHCLPEGKLYLVLGCATTTIYTATVDGADVSVLCVESLGGSRDKLAAYLAHEYTHFVRKELLAKDIFESCVGERLVTEGIAESYSKDVAPHFGDAECCIVDEATVAWVKAHMGEMQTLVREGLEGTELMEQLFYMYAKISMPVRTGYVYGYLAVRSYLEAHQLQTKDILGIDWREVLA